jgi:hypothetical protein
LASIFTGALSAGFQFLSKSGNQPSRFTLRRFGLSTEARRAKVELNILQTVV